MMTEEKKGVFEQTRQFDEHLRKIREKERQVQGKLQQIRGDRLEQEQRERHAARLEAEKKMTTEDADLRAVKTESDHIKEQLEALTSEFNILRQKYVEQTEWLEEVKEDLRRQKYCKTLETEKRREEKGTVKWKKQINHPEGAIRQSQDREVLKCDSDGNNEAPVTSWDENMHDEINSSSQRNVEQKESLEKLKENLQSIPSYFTNLQREKRQDEEDITKLMKHIKRLEDEMAAAQQIAVETQLRQMDEVQSLSQETRELKQLLASSFCQQQQGTSAEEQHQGKYF